MGELAEPLGAVLDNRPDHRGLDGEVGRGEYRADWRHPEDTELAQREGVGIERGEADGALVERAGHQLTCVKISDTELRGIMLP